MQKGATSESRVETDLARDVESAYMNVRIALRSDSIPNDVRAILVTARDQLRWTSEVLNAK